MSFRDCIIEKFLTGAERGDAVLAGRREKKLEEALAKYDGLVEEYRNKGMDADTAGETASKELLQAIERENFTKKIREVKQLQKQQKLEKSLLEYRNDKGEADFGKAALAMWEYDGLSKNENVMGRYQTLRGRFHSMFDKSLDKYAPKYAGTVQPKAGLKNIIREAFGDETGDASSKELYKEWAELAEFMRKTANRNGANIPARKNWRMPQKQSRVAVARAGKEKWVNDHMEWVDWETMKNPDTGLSIKPDERIKTLESIYDTLKTDGMIKAPVGITARKSLAARLENSRFLDFKDSKSWLAMHDAYGDGSVFDVMTSHIDKMSRDIALMEVFGPNPYSMKEYVASVAQNQAAKLDAKSPAPVKKAKELASVFITDDVRRFDELYEMFTNSNAASSENFAANVAAGTRDLLTSAYLGGASLLAIPGDMFTTAMTRLFSKHTGTKDLSRYLKLMNPLDKGDRQLAVRLGLIAENATAMAYGQQRFMNQVMGPNITKRIADTVLRASLLSPHTQAARWSFGMETLGMFADAKKMKFDELPFKESLSKHGISADDWDLFRSTENYAPKDGATFLRPDDLLSREDINSELAYTVANKFMDYVHTEGQFAVPTASLGARAVLGGTTRPGTLIGEISRSFAMFKNFPITIIMTHVRRGLYKENFSSKAAYLATLGIGMTMVGALATQMRQIRDGKDPITMNPTTPEGRKFWGGAALTGGGMGIWGDFIFNDVNRYGSGITQTAAGPVTSFAGDALKLTVGNALEVAQGKETNFGSEAFRFVKRNHPGGSLWYSKLVMQRLVWDQLQKEVDDDAYKKFKSMKTRARKEYDQEYWWGPGNTEPSRSPNLSAAIE